MPSRKLKAMLDEKNIPYQVVKHWAAYTAQEVAEEMRIHGRHFAKATIVKVDGNFVMAVLPAPLFVDLARLRVATGGHDLALAAETEFRGLFPECEAGAEPPFGNLYGLPVYVDARLEKANWIAFNAGTHTEAMSLGYADYRRLVKPTVVDFGVEDRPTANTWAEGTSPTPA